MKLRIRTATSETFASLKHSRNFRLFFGGQLISQIGNWLTMVAMVLLVLKLGGNGLSLGLLAVCQFGPVLFIGAWAGLVADRSDKRKLLLLVQTVAMAQSFALAGLAFMSRTPLLPLFLVAMVGGVTTAFDNPTRRSFVTEMVPEEDVSNAVSINSALMTSARVFGPALAGLLVVTLGFGWAFAIDGLSYLAVLLGLYLMRTEELRPSTPAPRAKGQVREGLRYVTTVPALWIPLVMMTVVGTLSFNFQIVFPLFVEKTLHGSITEFTVFYSIVSLGSLIAALGSARRTHITVEDVVKASAFFGAAMLVIAASPSLIWVAPFGMLVGFGSISFLVASTAIVQIEANANMRGRVLALQSMVFLGSTPIGGPILGLICDQFGARAGFVVGGVAALGAAGFGVIAGRRVLQAGGTPDRDEERNVTGEVAAAV
jgi:MFS family permease